MSIESIASITAYPILPVWLRFVPFLEMGWYSSLPMASRSNTVTNYREGKSLCVPYAVHACYELA